MKDWKFVRPDPLDARAMEEAVARFRALLTTEEDEREFDEAVREGRVVLGPLGPDGEPLANR